MVNGASKWRSRRGRCPAGTSNSAAASSRPRTATACRPTPISRDRLLQAVDLPITQIPWTASPSAAASPLAARPLRRAVTGKAAPRFRLPAGRLCAGQNLMARFAMRRAAPAPGQCRGPARPRPNTADAGGPTNYPMGWPFAHGVGRRDELDAVQRNPREIERPHRAGPTRRVPANATRRQARR